MRGTESNLSGLSNQDLADAARDAIIDRDPDKLDRVSEEMKKRAEMERNSDEFKKIAKEHREKWQKRAWQT